MGYSEQLCQICGVSFNISRIRTDNEPRTAGWDYIGDDSFIEADTPDSFYPCGPASGCLFNARLDDVDNFMSPWKAQNEKRSDADNHDTVGSGCTTDAPDREANTEVGHLFDHEAFQRHFGIPEHIAGPGCKSTQGYSGHRISMEEMQGCRIVQCLVRKQDHFTPQDDDQDFERTEDFFLSGLADGMPDTESSGDMETVPIHRHGLSVTPSNVNWDDQSERSEQMPFHPWCLEVFKRTSLSTRGSVDLAGLHGWYDIEDDWDTVHEFPRHDNITRLQEQWWCHEPGTEYVAANPLFIPSLPSLLRSCIVADPSFTTSNGAFKITNDLDVTSEDSFASLPMEIRLMILERLPSKTIANLRLASRTFRQLPIALWHSLLLREMPWLWEAWPEEHNIPYYFWATISVEDLKSNPNISSAAVPVPDRLPMAQTNWHQLYVLLKRNGSSLKGLQNRERIWHDCEEIVRRVEAYRKSGQIPAVI